MIFKPFFLASGFWYHRRSGVWLDRSWDEIPEFVVRAGLLIYTVVFIPGVLLLIGCGIGMLGEWLGWWPGSASRGWDGL